MSKGAKEEIWGIKMKLTVSLNNLVADLVFHC